MRGFEEREDGRDVEQCEEAKLGPLLPPVYEDTAGAERASN